MCSPGHGIWILTWEFYFDDFKEKLSVSQTTSDLDISQINMRFSDLIEILKREAYHLLMNGIKEKLKFSEKL